jgi:hypothetical protein
MKILRFIPSLSVNKNFKHPVPMKKIIPEWFTKAERTYFDKHKQEIAGLKTCVPFLDGLTFGYALVIPEDIFVSRNENGELKIEWESGIPFIGEREGLSGHTIPRPAGHEHNHLTWSGNWGWKTPKGYSTLVTHPLNRFDLPFTTMSAVIDTDGYNGWGNIPWFIKSGFEGVIPAGTPYAQIIPVKREKWMYVQDWLSTKKVEKQGDIVRSGKGMYKKIWRKEKDFS